MELEGELGPGSRAGEGMCSHVRSEHCRSCLNSVAEELEQVGSFLTELLCRSFAILHNFRCCITWLSLCQFVGF